MSAHTAAITLATAAGVGVVLISVAERLRVPSITLLLLGGMLLGPHGIGVVDPGALGAGLEVVVTLAVAVILFEGGLTLDVAGFRREPTVIVRLLTIGVLVTWVGTAATIYWLHPEFGFALSIIAGSLVIVTGPTVVSPLLRRIGVQPRLHHVLYWEGVLVDAVGVFIAVLCYEWIASRGDEIILMPLGRFASRFIIGAGVGLAVGVGLGALLRRGWVAREHTNIVVLGGAMLTLGLSNSVLAESGILAVITAGLVLSMRDAPRLKQLKRFKLELTEIGIGLLFVLLAAKLDLSHFAEEGWRLVAILAVILLLLRPMNVAISTWGQGFSWRERAFLSWLAPRGIVAASMASLFSIRLQRLGYDQAQYLETLTYAVIGVTVFAQGLSAPAVARVLGLQRRSRATWLLIGDPTLTTELHRQLRQVDARSLVMALDGTVRADPEAAAVEVVADPLRPESAHDPRIADVEAVLAMAGDPSLNDRICEAWSPVVGPGACYRWDERGVEASAAHGSRVWADLIGPAELKAGIEAGTHALEALEVGGPADAARFGEALQPLLSIDDGHIAPLDGATATEAAAVLALRRRIPGLYGLVRDVMIIDKHRTTFEEVVRGLLDLASRATPGLPVDAHLAEILDRERTMSTALGAGVAIPHVYDDHSERSTCYVASVVGGLDVLGPDEQPVSLVFLVVSPSGKAREHLRSLAAIARLAGDRGLLEVLERQRTRGRLLALLRERE